MTIPEVLNKYHTLNECKEAVLSEQELDQVRESRFIQSPVGVNVDEEEGGGDGQIQQQQQQTTHSAPTLNSTAFPTTTSTKKRPTNQSHQRYILVVSLWIRLLVKMSRQSSHP
jgi:hypothetical protein